MREIDSTDHWHLVGNRQRHRGCLETGEVVHVGVSVLVHLIVVQHQGRGDVGRDLV